MSKCHIGCRSPCHDLKCRPRCCPETRCRLDFYAFKADPWEYSPKVLSSVPLKDPPAMQGLHAALSYIVRLLRFTTLGMARKAMAFTNLSGKGNAGLDFRPSANLQNCSSGGSGSYGHNLDRGSPTRAARLRVVDRERNSMPSLSIFRSSHWMSKIPHD